MDETGRNRWLAKLEQHRTIRAGLLNPVRHPSAIYEDVKAYNGALIEDWMKIFEESWNRSSHISVAKAAAQAKGEIEDIIAKEKTRIKSQIREVFASDPAAKSAPMAQALSAGEQSLDASCEVLKYKAFSVIDNQRAERSGKLWTEVKSWIELGLAIFGAFLLYNQTRIAERQIEIQIAQEKSAASEKATAESVIAARLVNQIEEIWDFYPERGRPLFPTLQRWEKKSLFAKVETLLKAEESNQVLVKNPEACSHWRKAVNLSRQIQTEHVLEDEKRFQRTAGLVREELGIVLGLILTDRNRQ